MQAVRELCAEKDAQIAALEEKNATLEARLAALEKLMQSPQTAVLKKGRTK